MNSMRSAYATVSVAIAGYFATSLGLDAARAFGSPLHGLEVRPGSDPISALGRLIGLEPGGVIGVALCLGAFELATAAVLVAYLLERMAGDDRLQGSRRTLEAALILVAIQSVIVLVASLTHLDGGSVRLSVIHLALVGIAALLAGLERGAAGDEIGSGPSGDAEPPMRKVPNWDDPASAGWFSV
ncbi:MAG: hypothetical protein ABSG76_20160 [Xanthobacteraceae bacterium]